MKEQLNSEYVNSTIHWVCSECGIRGSKATHPNKKEHCFSSSTFHKWICDFCKKEKSVTEARDFFYPNFNLIIRE